MKLFYIFIAVNQLLDCSAISMRSFARNSRRRIPEWLENGHFNGHFNDHRHKKSVRESQSKVGPTWWGILETSRIVRDFIHILTIVYEILYSATEQVPFFTRSVQLHFDPTQWQIQKTRNRLWQK